ncbi:SDR family NAD(P)-dependent oxidoreductase [Jiulongibacter sp. NS-SX5]|uniref:SDR family NAD(P)-dependent oxidoreductase n=1 Tax=Jiulongibacter sp. NS-SX5 TaxID=3463854 RepID=UPI0040582D27
MNTNPVTIVTGATSGIGKSTAKILSEKGHEIIVVARNKDKANDLLKELGDDSRFIQCDFSNLQSVHDAALKIIETTPVIDNLINNAGAIFDKRELTKDGFEQHFGVNHLAPFLLTTKLLPLILKSDGKIINVASDIYKQAKPDLNNLQLENGYSPMLGYANSKLFNILFTKELSKRYRIQNLKAYALHPGVIKSGFGDSLNGFFKLMMILAKPFMKSPDQGAATSAYLASEEDPKAPSGSYFKNSQLTRTADQLVNEDLAAKIWNISEEMTSKYK